MRPVSSLYIICNSSKLQHKSSGEVVRNNVDIYSFEIMFPISLYVPFNYI